MTTNDILKRLCGNIAAGRFNWRKYCTPQSYFGWEICVTPLHCSYGQIGYTVHFHDTKLLQKSEMRKDIVIELSYKGFS
ncbi:hypothetical protein [Bacteroides finegoldii]|uniref:Uncharacterized protein n=1 Tax=Bacteroides finegoldii TaxID=338188 RepID=A0A7J4YJ51_9BACE|nr:hypothetical protein [Bacteroides finegoldii]KAA5215693.1 hypothetical protein F2Z28_15220 [Bacteroides finegoldii]KAA5219627.1 hypothetical protein F2Z16_15405 [Bacteroides finegoldii]KAA5223159.1 hypothetical protein F2Z20_19205 [Bacteroides finegoldii]KAA5227175.1 hypothetical protein F2Z22_19635 [Bacteroides finegoldii]KAA5233537.1 hypothetical protein F2Z17_15150 [Bacteroides finegoldii]